jgi:uncharacterized protein (DUF1499 family)
MELPDLKSLFSASTARTYPVMAKELARAVEEAVRSLPRWMVEHATEEEIQATRKIRFLSFTDDVTVSLTQTRTGANINSRAGFVSAPRKGIWELGQNRRNLEELLAAIDQELTS